ncbi:MAG: hypothetical protein K2K41_09190, partial [Ruminiclostridium sp.]|nr:hypothetical protein [Ruminiclostridium sp.]
MKMFLKRIVGAVSALTAAVTLIALNAPKSINAASETISGGHSHVMCGNLVHDNCTHENIEFEPFPENNEILRGKSYYLTKDIVLDKQTRIFIEQGTTNICLNGYSIKKEGGQIIDINSIQGQGAVLNICDCDSRTGVSGKIINTSDDSEYACISVIDQSEFNLYGGIVDGGANGIGIEVEKISDGVSQGGSANIYGGTVQTQYNCALWIDDSDTSLSVFGGKIKSDGYNAVVVTGERSNVLICGGEVIGSAADYETIYIYGEEAAVTINGGSITGENYGAAYCVYGTLNITGGEVKSESYKGSTIYNEDTLVLSGGTVSCSGYYGITNFGGGKTTISGGELKSDGSAINNLADSEVEIDGGDISSEDYSGIY